MHAGPVITNNILLYLGPMLVAQVFRLAREE